MTFAMSDCKSAALYEEINALVIEYLELNGLDKTIVAFSSECRQRSLPGPFNSADDTKAAFSYYEGEKLLKSFDEGSLETFVKLWKSFQSHVQVTSDDMKKLEVYLRVHFALWPCAHDEPEGVQTQAMNHLKVFFEEQSCQLSHDAAILPLFALPYVSDPKNHPIFKDLFQPTWSQRLRAQLEATLLKYYDLLQQNLGVHSKLAAIVISSRSKDVNLNFRSDRIETPLPLMKTANTNTNAIVPVPNYHRERFFQLVKTYRQARRLLKNTRESYGKLLKIANELIIGLESAVGGQKFNFEPIMKKCYEIFPELFTPIDPEGGIGQPNKEYFKRLAHSAHSAQFDNIIDSDVSLFFIGLVDVSPDNLDYEKIKTVLVHEDTNNLDKLCLLQALRWLLTKSTPKCRQTSINAFIDADIFGLSSPDDDYRLKIFDCMMSQNPTYLKECFARLLNTFASMKCGRAYMGTSTECVDLLVKSLLTFKGLNESYICQMVIATLQKLSLRKQMRLEMIDRKVIQWLVKYLKNEFARTDSNSTPENKYYNPYLMEYAWALLMNLCLHEESRNATTSIASDIVSCVTQMLISKPSREVYPYVISTLYSLLRNPEIFATAKKMGIQSLFANCQNVEDTEMSHHFNHVTAILQTEGFDRVNTTTGEVDYDDDDDIDPTDFEPELEVSEAWEESLSDMNYTGDDLLMRKYLNSSGSSFNESFSPQISSPTFSNIPQTKMSPKPTQRLHGGLIIRPTTPKNLKYDNLLEDESYSASPHSRNSTMDEDSLEPFVGSPAATLSPRIKVYDLHKYSESTEQPYQDANQCLISPMGKSKQQRNNASSNNNYITILGNKPERHRILPERTALVTVNDRNNSNETETVKQLNQAANVPKLLSSPHHNKAEGTATPKSSGKHHKNPPAKRKTSRLLEKKRPQEDRTTEHRQIGKHTTHPG